MVIDGDGTGDDRRLNVLLKNLIKWAHYTDQSSPEHQQLYDRMLAQISHCEFAVRRSQLLSKTNKHQLLNYKQLQNKLESQIGDVKNTIDISKQNLAQAKILKQNRMMYDLLAQSIKQQPARKQTNKRLEELEIELNALRDQRKNLEQRLEMRRKQFHVLMSSANQLHAMLEDSTDDDLTNTSLDDIANSPGPETMSE